MQDSRNQNAIALLTVKHGVLAMLQATQARANLLKRRIVGQRLATNLKLTEVTGGLGSVLSLAFPLLSPL